MIFIENFPLQVFVYTKVLKNLPFIHIFSEVYTVHGIEHNMFQFTKFSGQKWSFR